MTSASVLVPDYPGVPTSVATLPADRSALVEWLPPSSDGGSPITLYTVRFWAALTGGEAPVATCDTGTIFCIATGLVNGKSYWVDVVSTNAVGSSLTATSPRVLVKPTKAPLAVVKPVITGSLFVGQKLTASAGFWSPKPSGFKYQWLRNGKAIKGATKNYYVLAAADLGTQISVTVFASKTSWTTGKRLSASTAVVGRGTLTASPVPVIKGTAKKLRTLTVSTGTWKPAKVTLRYAWYRDSVLIVGATKSTYKLGVADVGHRINVEVTGSKAGYDSVVRGSLPTAVGVA